MNRRDFNKQLLFVIGSVVAPVSLLPAAKPATPSSQIKRIEDFSFTLQDDRTYFDIKGPEDFIMRLWGLKKRYIPKSHISDPWGEYSFAYYLPCKVEYPLPDPLIIVLDTDKERMFFYWSGPTFFKWYTDSQWMCPSELCASIHKQLI